MGALMRFFGAAAPAGFRRRVDEAGERGLRAEGSRGRLIVVGTGGGVGEASPGMTQLRSWRGLSTSWIQSGSLLPRLEVVHDSLEAWPTWLGPRECSVLLVMARG
jgi:hypothetical protein